MTSTLPGQLTLPGCEEEPCKLLLQRKADAALAPATAQKPCNIGLFGDDAQQIDLIDQLRSKVMSKWYDASQAVVEAANIAMREIADSNADSHEKVDLIHNVWQPVATALCDSIRDDLDENWPDEAALAKALDVDCVGQTSDTGKIVSWGPDTGDGFRPFHIHETPE